MLCHSANTCIERRQNVGQMRESGFASMRTLPGLRLTLRLAKPGTRALKGAPRLAWTCHQKDPPPRSPSPGQRYGKTGPHLRQRDLRGTRGLSGSVSFSPGGALTAKAEQQPTTLGLKPIFLKTGGMGIDGSTVGNRFGIQREPARRARSRSQADDD